MSKVTCAVVAIVVVLGLLACAVACVVAFGVLSYYDVQLDERAQVQATTVTEVSVDSPETLTVRNPQGNVTIRAGQVARRIEVEATKEVNAFFNSQAERLLDDTEVRVQEEQAETIVEVALPERSRSGVQRVRVNLVITVPGAVAVDVMNEAGHVQVEGTEGSVRVRSGAGNVRLEGVTVNEGCDVMNTAGNVAFEGELPEPGDRGDAWEVLLRTETGDIDFAVPDDSVFTFDAESETGTVRSKLEVEVLESGRVRGDVGEFLKGSVNGSEANPNVILRTETGHIRAAPLP